MCLRALYFENFLGRNQDKGRQFHFLPRAPGTHATPLYEYTVNLAPVYVLSIYFGHTLSHTADALATIYNTNVYIFLKITMVNNCNYTT